MPDLKLTRADWLILQRCFDAEVRSALSEHGLPPQYQTRSKRAAVLAEAGYIQELTITLPGRFPIRVTGWVLTPLGHLTWCQHSAKTSRQNNPK